MALSEFDRSLLERCLAREPRSWENFVDRFLGLVLHVVNHTALSRGMKLSESDREDLVSSVFLAIVDQEFAVLRNFRGNSSLATYLTVVSRRVVVKELLKRSPVVSLQDEEAVESVDVESRIEDREEVDRLLAALPENEATVVRMYHLEGKTYNEISANVGIPTNSIGSLLSRARTKLRSSHANLG